MMRQSIVSLLQKATGIDEASIGAVAINFALQRRIQQSSASNEASYLKLLQSSPSELTALTEEVVVPETWFFRQEEAFRLMINHLTGDWKKKHFNRKPRILSVPTSHGEEPYSAAMAMLDAGFQAGDFEIEGVDISHQALLKAKRGIFSKGSFRGQNLDFKKRYFREANQGFILDPSVCDLVKFKQGNLLDIAQMEKMGSYDIIFCRNVLIYFNEQDRKRTAQLLHNMLRRDGLLFVGHAETGLIWKGLFDAVTHPYAFAFEHQGKQQLKTEKKMISASPMLQGKSKLTVLPGAKKIEPSSLSSKPWQTASIQQKIEETTSTHESRVNLERASKLANQGRLDEAKAECECYLREHEATAQAWFLMGLIADNQGQLLNAKDAYRKALYLDANHHETLVHYALLLEQLGDMQAAKLLKERFRRLSVDSRVDEVRR